MRAALKLNCTVRIGGLRSCVLGGQPQIAGRAALDAGYGLMGYLWLAAAASRGVEGGEVKVSPNAVKYNNK